MRVCRTVTRYEAFAREGAKVNYRADWHPGDGTPFLGRECFVKKIAKETIPPSFSRRATLRGLLKSVAVQSAVPAGDIRPLGAQELGRVSVMAACSQLVFRESPSRALFSGFNRPPLARPGRAC
jgi:hypothetical protein